MHLDPVGAGSGAPFDAVPLSASPVPDPLPEPEPLPAGAASVPGASFLGARYTRLVLVLGLMAAIGPVTVDTYLPALPHLTAELHASPALAQLTLTGTMLGMGLGQLLLGPLSDTVGRRRPLVIGLLGHLIASVLCAVAPTVEVLAAVRLVQGLCGAAVAVVATAVVRDLFTGHRAASLLSRLMLVSGVAPILAPSLGGFLLTITSWRGIFGFMAIAAACLAVVALIGLPETLPVERRIPAGLGGSARAYRELVRDPLFVIMVGVTALTFGAMFSYVSASPFVLQNIYGLSPQRFALVFGLNALGLIASSQLNPALVRRFGPVRVLAGAIMVGLAAAVALLVVAGTGWGGLAGFIPPLFIVVASLGLAFPNAPTVALGLHGEAAGTASALLGSTQFVAGGLAAPLVGALTHASPVPMVLIMIGCLAVPAALMLIGRRRLGAVHFG